MLIEIARYIDFREGGKEGLAVFDEIEYPGTSILLGRPKNGEDLPGDNAGITSLIQSFSTNGFGGIITIHH